MLSERLKKSIKDYPDFPKKGIIFKDISPILADHELFSELINKISKYPVMDKTDAIIAIDARGFIFGSALAQTINKPLILARKENKLPGKLTKLNYRLEYGNDTLCIQDSSVEPFSKFVIVDDLLATGGTAKCVLDLLRLKEKEVLALCIIIELTELKGAESIHIPVYSEIKY